MSILHLMAGNPQALLVNTLLVNTWLSCVSGISWPSGQYGLPQPASGCPSGWKSGWIFQDRIVNNQSAATRVPEVSHLKGTFTQIGTKRYVCMKTVQGPPALQTWPDGQYCIYRQIFKSCPPGFAAGSITWNDNHKHIPNKNTHKGILPDGIYTINTTIKYCCKVNGSKENIILLPVNKPFLLLAYNSSQCQSVKWTRSTQEYLQFSREDYKQTQGLHPFVDEDNALRFCYYQSSNKTLTENEGTITLYLNKTSIEKEQYSAWSIRPNNDHNARIALRFQQFSFHANSNNSYIEVFDGDDESSLSLGRFSSVQSPPNTFWMSSTNQLFVLLVFADTSGTYEFQLNYRIVLPTASTTVKTASTLSSSSTSTSLSTTSMQSSSSSSTNSTHRYLRSHDNMKKTLLLSTLLPAAGLLICMLVVYIIWRRHKRIEYVCVRLNCQTDSSEISELVDSEFDDVEVTATVRGSQLSVTGKPT